MRLENIVNTRRVTVPGTGPKDAKIIVVGGAPTSQEEHTRKPFSSSAGQLLSRLLFRAKIISDECYLTYVIKEKPPSGEGIERFINLKGKNIKTSDTWDNYLLLLKEEIREINPNVVVAVGNVALYALTGETGITNFRGSILESTLIPGLKVVATLDPQMAIRNFMYQYYIFYDLQRVKEQADFPYIKVKERDYILNPTLKQVHEYLDLCLKQTNEGDLVSFDIEVGGYKIGLSEVSCISFSLSPTSSICIPFTKGGQINWSPEEERKIWLKIGMILESNRIKKVAQNKFFDSHFLFRRYGFIVRNCEDTMIAHAIAFPDFPKGLDFITSTQTDMNYYKADGKEFFGGAGNEEHFWLYNAKDSIVLSEAWWKLKGVLESQGNWETYVAQNGIVESLVFMSEHGIKLDAEKLSQKAEDTGKEIELLEIEIEKLVGRPINPRSPKQLGEYFYGDKADGNLGLKPYLGKTGKPTTDEGALLRLARPLQSRPAIPVARILLRHRSLSKMKGTYFEMTYDDDGRVRASMNPVGTKTGRLSSSQNIFGTGANLQNQPGSMKEYFLVDDNHIAYEIDLSQAENRIVAYVAPEYKLIEAFENKIDIHARTASYIFGKPESEISDEPGSAPQFGNGEHSERYWGKTANHAFNYGQSANAFSEQMLISRGEAQTIYHAYHNAYPGIAKYQRMVKEMLTKSRTLTNLYGRRYRFLDRWDYGLFLQAYAFIPQSTIADIINRRGLLNIYYKMPEVVILNQIHDSLVFQISKDVPLVRHAEIIKQIAAWMSAPISWNEREFSIPCDINMYTVNLMDGKEIFNHQILCKEEIAKQIESHLG